MSETTINTEIKAIGQDDLVPFTYPDGFNQVAKTLDFLPDNGTRENLLSAMVFVALWL